MFQWWHKSWGERTLGERIAGICFAVLILLIFCLGVYFAFHSAYHLKFVTADRAMIVILLGFLAALEKLILVEWLQKHNKPLIMANLLFILVMSVFFIQIAGVIWLKLSDEPLQTTRATVLKHYTKANTYETLLTNGTKVGDYGVFGIRIPKNEVIQQGDCLTVQYRENWLVIEIQMKQNHGKRDKKACFVY